MEGEACQIGEPNHPPWGMKRGGTCEHKPTTPAKISSKRHEAHFLVDTRKQQGQDLTRKECRSWQVVFQASNAIFVVTVCAC
jgi:hypothetical protein